MRANEPSPRSRRKRRMVPSTPLLEDQPTLRVGATDVTVAPPLLCKSFAVYAICINWFVYNHTRACTNERKFGKLDESTCEMIRDLSKFGLQLYVQVVDQFFFFLNNQINYFS